MAILAEVRRFGGGCVANLARLGIELDAEKERSVGESGTPHLDHSDIWRGHLSVMSRQAGWSGPMILNSRENRLWDDEGARRTGIGRREGTPADEAFAGLGSFASSGDGGSRVGRPVEAVRSGGLAVWSADVELIEWMRRVGPGRGH